MPGRDRLALAGLVVGALLAAAGFARLLELRLTGGDVYPPSSSHRADPLGTRALHDALARLPGLTVARNHAPLARLGDGSGATLFVLGSDGIEDEEDSSSDGTALRRFVATGGRLVIALPGEETRTVFAAPRPTPRAPQPQATPPPGATPTPVPPRVRFLLESWGVAVARHGRPAGVKSLVARATDTAATLGLPRELGWHGDESFEIGPGWSVLYLASGYPVAVERRAGPGSLVLLSDSWLLSNEALVKERRPALLAHLAGSSRRLVFDETHLGVFEAEGVASLGRRYRLTPFVLAAFVVAALFVWRNASSLLPRRGAARAGAEVVAGRDSFAGLVGLLARTVPPKELPRALVDEWERTAGPLRPLAPRLRETAASAPDAVTAYARLRRITETRRRRG